MNIAQLKAYATIIKNETGVDKNTAVRIGVLFQEIINFLNTIDLDGDGITTLTISSREELDAITKQGIYIIQGASNELLIVLKDGNSITTATSEAIVSVLETYQHLGTPAMDASGNIIICPSADNNSRIAKLNISLDAASEFYTTLNNEEIDFTKATLAPNGKLYAVMEQSGTIIKIAQIDPAAATFTIIGSTYNLTNSQTEFATTLLAPNGMIYAMPAGAAVILEINYTAGTTRTFGAFGAESFKWRCYHLAENAKIYGLPFLGKNSIIEYVPGSEVITEVAVLNAEDCLIVASALHPNGNIYGFTLSANAGRMVVFNPATAEVHSLASDKLNSVSSCALAPDGSILVFTSRFDENSQHYAEVLKVNVDSETITLETVLNTASALNPILGIDAKIYGIPAATGTIQILNGGWELADADTQMPSLPQLATSKYNKYFNR